MDVNKRKIKVNLIIDAVLIETKDKIIIKIPDLNKKLAKIKFF